MSNKTVHFVSAPMGSGKTTNTINFIKSTPVADRFVIGTPNTTLSIETAARLAAEGISVCQIDSSDGTNCKNALIAALEKGNAKVIISNRDVILNLDRRYFGSCHVIFDEIMNPYERIDLDGIVISKRDVKSYFTVKPSVESPDYLDCFVTAEGIDFLSKWRSERLYHLKSDNDNQRHPLPLLIETMSNLHYGVRVEAGAFSRFIDGDGKRLSFFILAKPSIFDGFHSCTILGANFADSLLYLLLQNDIDFVPHPVIKGSYESFSHKADLVKLFYFSNMNCTKHFMDSLKDGVQGFLDRAAIAVEARFGAVPHIFCVNNPEKIKVDGKWQNPAPYKWALEESYDGEPNRGKRVSPDPNGINELRDRNIAIHLAALNYGTMDFRFFDLFFSISSEEVVRSMTFERISQFMGRTSFRVEKSREQVTFITFDRRSAEYMQGLIGCGQPEMIDLGIDELHEQKRMSKDEQKSAHNAKIQRYRDKKNLEKRLEAQAKTEQHSLFGCRFWATRYVTEAERTTFLEMNFDDFVDNLKWLSEKEAKKKSDLEQLRVGNFADLGNHLTAGNIVSSNMLLMDIDGSSRRPEELSEYLNFTHVIVQSFRSTYEDPRFHLFIPLDASVNEDNYRHIASLVMADINARFSDAFEIDTNFKSINTSISVPCKSKSDSDIFICRRIWKDALTREYKFLNVIDYLNRRLPKRERNTKLHTEECQAVIDPNDHIAAIAIANEYVAQCEDGKRDELFKKVGVVLFGRGFAPDVIIAVLNESRARFGKKDDKNAAERLVDWLIRNRDKVFDTAA